MLRIGLGICYTIIIVRNPKIVLATIKAPIVQTEYFLPAFVWNRRLLGHSNKILIIRIVLFRVLY